MVAITEERYEAALVSLQTAADAADPFEDSDARKADTLSLLGTTLARFQRVDEADSVLTRALALRTENLGLGHPLVAGTLYVMGEMYRHSNRLLEAQHALVVASEITERLGLQDELTAEIEMSASLVLKQTGQTGESTRHAVKAARLLPPDSPRRQALADLVASLEIAHGAFELAADSFARIAARQEPGPELSATLGALADMQLIQGLWESALATAERVLEFEPHHAGILRRKAVALSRLGRCDEAEDVLLAARELSFLGKAQLTKMMAEVNLRAERWERAIERFEEAISLLYREPLLRVQIRLALGKLYLKMNRREEAGRQFARAASARRRMRRAPLMLVAEALFLLGQVLNAEGRQRLAYRRLSKALFLMESDLIPVSAMTEQEQADAYELTLLILQEMSLSLEMGGRLKSAASVLESVVSARRESAFTSSDNLALLLEKLAGLYDRAGYPEKSLQVKEQAHWVRNPPRADSGLVEEEPPS